MHLLMHRSAELKDKSLPPSAHHFAAARPSLLQIMFWACSHLPWLVAWVVRSEAAAALRRPVHTLRQSFAPYSAPADVQTLKRPEVRPRETVTSRPAPCVP